mgnify:CR=1 FL=1
MFLLSGEYVPNLYEFYLGIASFTPCQQIILYSEGSAVAASEYPFVHRGQGLQQD